MIIRHLLPACILSLALAPAAFAQIVPPSDGSVAPGEVSTGPTPPPVDDVEERSPIFRYAALFVLSAAAIGVTIIPGKRSHND